MKNLQRGIGVLTLIALLMMANTLFAQESTEEATEAVEATEMVEEATEAVEATEMVEEVTEAVEATEMVEEATEEAEMTPEVTEAPVATAAPEVTPEVTVEAVATEEPITEVEATVNVVGSGVVNPALQSLVNASGSIVDYNIATTGSSAGFEQFCAGGAEMTTSIRPITVEEDTACREAGVEYLELQIGYDVLVVVSNVEDNFLACLTFDNLNNIFAPGATATNWSDISLTSEDPAAALTPTPAAEVTPEATEEAVILPDITVLIPEDTSLSYETLDQLVIGFGFRSDAQNMDAASIINAVETTPGAIGVVPLSVATAPDANVYINGLNFNGFNCEQPSVLAVETGSYPVATPLYLYVATRAQDTLAFFLDFLTGTAAVQPLVDAGYSPVSVETSELNAAIIRGEASARATTAEEITFEIPPNLTGNITIVGASSGFSVASSNAQRLTGTQETLTIDNSFSGETSGIETFCAGEADILFVNGDASNLCEGNVPYVSYDFGYQAVVLVANAGDNFTTCLTLDHLNTIWSATSTDTVTQWSQVAEAFPEQDITLVGINAGNVLTDVLMGAVSDGTLLPVRSDVAESNSNEFYRAAAIANVSGALTYMSLVDYQNVVNEGQSNIQLVAIDTGSGCVVPSEETILDGSYPLTRHTAMVVKQSSLATSHVQSFVWTVFSEANASIIDVLDLAGGFQTQDALEFRSNLLIQFEEAEQAQIVAAEVTAEVTAEATEDASGE